LEFEERNIRVA